MLLKKGDNNEQVKQLQIKLGVDPVGNYRDWETKYS